MVYLRPILHRPPPRRSSRRHPARRRLPLWIPIAVVAILILGAGGFVLSKSGHSRLSRLPAIGLPGLVRERPVLGVYRPPTGQSNLLDTTSTAVFMPSGSGRVESALYDSSRMRVSGGRVLPAFHEGIDIAPLQRDRAGRPLDPVWAATTGVVAHVSRHAGNSNYGIYVVIRHKDAVGEIYTLYAHLASIRPGLAVGLPVDAGDPLGVMGHTSSSAIPLARSHLHFEVGTILNTRFADWFRTLKAKPDRGLYHGWNLAGIDPLAVFRAQAADGGFSMKDYLLAAPSAFTLIVRGRAGQDYFRRYPALWQSGEPLESAGAVALMVSVGGVPLRGRAATAEEVSRIGGNGVRVQEVDESLLGRNSRRLIVRGPAPGCWILSAAGEQWLEIFQYPSVRSSRRGRPVSDDE
jgi:murein DD-endopeptidase MepM/ murein hydrolase activator NlpD